MELNWFEAFLLVSGCFIFGFLFGKFHAEMEQSLENF